MKRLLSVLCFSMFLAACSSTKLDPAPVGDAKPSTSSSASDSSRKVEPVVVDPSKTGAKGPANAARIIYFDFDSFVIKPEFQGDVEAHAKYLTADRSRKLNIEGHTDERGGREYNLALGQKRSEAVRRALALLGVADNQVEAVSFGKEKPAEAGSSEAAWAKNRRAELNYR
jgi:peptidoglycan-associated lipoprotein